MNPAAHADIAVLAERVDSLDQRLDSTRQRFDDHAQAQGIRDGELTRALQAIQLDVADIRAGKRAMLWLARIVLAAVVTLGGGALLLGKWATDHYLQDRLEARP